MSWGHVEFFFWGEGSILLDCNFPRHDLLLHQISFFLPVFDSSHFDEELAENEIQNWRSVKAEICHLGSHLEQANH